MTGHLLSRKRSTGFSHTGPDLLAAGDGQGGRPVLTQVNHALPGQSLRVAGQVLCADPGRLDTLLLQEVCELQGSCVDIVAAPDVAEVRRLLQEGNVQLVLVSPSLHDVSWEGLVSDLCALHAVPIWVWGGHAHPKERQRALAAGAAAYHDKPHDIEGYKTLLREIERVVEPR